MKQYWVAILFVLIASIQLKGQIDTVRIYFEHSVSQVSKVGENKIRKLSNDTKYRVVGYASPAGGTKYNDQLSKRRATAVSKYMATKGISSSNIQFEWKGELQSDTYDPKRVDIIPVKLSGNNSSNGEDSENELEGDVGPGLTDILGEKKSNRQTFFFKPNKDTTLFCKEGTAIRIHANSFKTNSNSVLELTVYEYYKLSDMIYKGLSTSSNDSTIETSGMIDLIARQKGEKISLKTGGSIDIAFPIPIGKTGFQVFNGVDHGHDVNWVRPRNGGFGRNNYRVAPAFKMKGYSRRFPYSMTGNIGQRRKRKMMYQMSRSEMNSPKNTRTDDFIVKGKLNSTSLTPIIGGDENPNKNGSTEFLTKILSKVLDKGCLPDGFLVAEFSKKDVLEKMWFEHESECLGDSVLAEFSQFPKWIKFSYDIEGEKLGYTKNKKLFKMRRKKFAVMDLNYERFVNSSVLGRKIFQIIAKDASSLPAAKYASLALSTSELGLVNCDRYIGTDEPLQDLLVKTNQNSRTILVYKEIKALLNAEFSNDSCRFRNVPIGKEIVLFSIYTAKKKIYVAEKSMKYDGKNHDVGEYKEIGKKELKARIEKLNTLY